MRLKRVFVAVNKWLALIVGVQIAVWMLSGLVMSALPIERVRGEHTIAKAPPTLVADMTVVIDAKTAARAAGGDVVAVTLTGLAGQAVYEIRRADGSAALVDAQGSGVLSPIDARIAQQIAAADFAGAGKPVSATLVEAEGGDYRGRLPAWRVQFDDSDDTRIYVAALDGRVSARRSGTWRVYDFFWMLHIMDYETREDFNTPLLVIASLLGLLVALSGLPLLWTHVLRPLVSRRRRLA